MKENQRYFKVVKGLQTDGSIVSTLKCQNHSRYKKYKELSKFFEFACRFSNNYNVSMDSIFGYCDVNDEDPISLFSIDEKGQEKLNNLRIIAKKCTFSYWNDSRFFIDFILEKARIESHRLIWKRHPSRFKSSFFFESIVDCVNYGITFNQYGPFQIIEVEFIKTKRYKMFDNSLIAEFPSYYTADEYLRQAKWFLNGENSDNPVNEIVFQGKYKIISQFPLTV